MINIGEKILICIKSDISFRYFGCFCQNSGYICCLLPLLIVFSAGVMSRVREVEAVDFYVGIESPTIKGQGR